MTFDEYQAAALQTANPRLDLWYALAKLTAEAGEALQLRCREEYHGKIYTREQMMDELGDIQWYLALAAQELATARYNALRTALLAAWREHGIERTTTEENAGGVVTAEAALQRLCWN